MCRYTDIGAFPLCAVCVYRHRCIPTVCRVCIATSVHSLCVCRAHVYLGVFPGCAVCVLQCLPSVYVPVHFPLCMPAGSGFIAAIVSVSVCKSRAPFPSTKTLMPTLMHVWKYTIAHSPVFSIIMGNKEAAMWIGPKADLEQ